MKTKILFLIAGAAIVTLSFSFASSTRSQKQVNARTSDKVKYSEPVGGFASDDKL